MLLISTLPLLTAALMCRGPSGYIHATSLEPEKALVTITSGPRKLVNPRFLARRSRISKSEKCLVTATVAYVPPPVIQRHLRPEYFRDGGLCLRFRISTCLPRPELMLSTSLLASFFLIATSVQAAPFSSSKGLYKRAEPQTAESINKQVHTNSTQVEIQYAPFQFSFCKNSTKG